MELQMNPLAGYSEHFNLTLVIWQLKQWKVMIGSSNAGNGPSDIFGYEDFL